MPLVCSCCSSENWVCKYVKIYPHTENSCKNNCVLNVIIIIIFIVF